MIRNGYFFDYYDNDVLAYKGHFINDKYDGDGTSYDKKGNVTYEGEWKCGYPHGKGSEYDNGQLKYVGDFQFNKRHGNGIIYLQDGGRYEGNFNIGYIHGIGTLYNINNIKVYDGSFVKNKFNGIGTYYFDNGIKHIGMFKNENRHGNGIIYHKNGIKYFEGMFKNDVANGKGTVYDENGKKRFVGMFVNDKRHGSGIEFDENENIVVKGFWERDKFIGEIQRKSKINKNLKTAKKTIPKKLKTEIWNKHIGEDIGSTMCLCCKKTKISQSNFHCGHIVAEANGGETNITNLKPICAQCNLSMGTVNMNDFMKLFEDE